jgi:hypothetical protein
VLNQNGVGLMTMAAKSLQCSHGAKDWFADRLENLGRSARGGYG